MNEAEKQKRISELKEFYKELRSYKNRQSRRYKTGFSEAQDRSLNALRLELQREHGRLREIISKYGGRSYIPILGTNYEVFGHSLGSLDMEFRGFDALDGAIGLVNEAIGKLESGVNKSDMRGEQGSIVAELEDFLRELTTYHYLQRRRMKGEHLNADELRIVTNLRSTLLRKSGKFRSLITDQPNKENMAIVGENGKERLYDIWFTGLKFEFDSLANEALDYCKDATDVAIGKLEGDIKTGIRDKEGNLLEKPHRILAEPPKAFISHGKRPSALEKLCDFLNALGIKPLVVEEQPSLDKTVDDKVNHYLSQADFVIILATGDDKIKSKLYPRPNVIHEIGLAQNTHAGKIIYLLEERAQFPSNISPKVHARFTPQSMDKAFTAIALELKELGILKVVKL